ncbi:MAG: shikimate kinase [Ignavibacteria bacterium]|nr:shikimate kinase [Ignavibacteria bacterium]
MNKRNNIVLIGFRGTGKTTLAKLLGKKLKRKVFSSDTVIERNERRTIASIIQKNGWKYFRDVESNVLVKLSNENGVIIDCGGGIVLRKKNRELLKRHSFIILLYASAGMIESRIANDENRIRLSKKKSLFEEIESQLFQRKKYYDELADIRFDTTQTPSKIILQRIISRFIKGDSSRRPE